MHVGSLFTYSSKSCPSADVFFVSSRLHLLHLLASTPECVHVGSDFNVYVFGKSCPRAGNVSVISKEHTVHLDFFFPSR